MRRKTALICRRNGRRTRLFGNPDWNGIDFVEVAGNQRSLCIHFFGGVPKGITVDNIRIEGGRRIRDITIVAVAIDSAHDPELDDCLRVTLDKPGDFSTYRICLVEPPTQQYGAAAPAPPGATVDEHRPLAGFDPRYACIDFTFKVDCPTDLDCRQPRVCAPEVHPAPEINYLAKDYASFRQLIFDRLAVTMPDWKERHVPDIGVTLVELLAYAGDHLSYYQDAVATEAYLDTSRQRVSVRRHARLVDYRMHEGNNARAWVTVATRTDLPPLGPGAFYFITGFADIQAASGRIVRASDLEQVPRDRYDVFEPLTAAGSDGLTFLAAHSEMRFHTWGDLECCLPKGATRATLIDGIQEAAPNPSGYARPRVLRLKAGDVLIFEERLGPTTGNAADADPAKRHAVRLTKVTPSTDGLLDTPIVEIEWGHEDALPFSLCLSSRLPSPDCRWIDDVSVACGNVVLVDHGRTVDETLGPVGSTETVGECACDGAIVNVVTVPERFRAALHQGPLTFSEPLGGNASAAKAIAQDAHRALPVLTLEEFQDAGDDTAAGPAWSVQYGLLSSGPDDRHFVVEMDDEGRGRLRFGDGELGRMPSAGTRMRSIYRVGNGAPGNVGRDTITYLVIRDGTLSTTEVKPRNPLPARGGTAPELSAEAKLYAPSAALNRRLRAITAGDYAELAQQNPRLQRAAAELRWTGSWYEARVAVDPAHREKTGARLLDRIEGELFPYRRIGHDLAVVEARYVPLDVALYICVEPHFTRGQVKAELLQVFSNRGLAGGRLGFFHPDNLTFGDGIYLSQLVAAAIAVDGVATAKVTRLRRLRGPDDGALDSGALLLSAMEVAQLDADPDFPENGQLELIMRGGR